MAEALAKYGPRGHCRVGGARPNRGATAQARRAMRHGAKQSEGVIECAVTAVLLAHEAPRRGKIVRHKPKWGISPVAELLSHLRGTISGWGHLRRFGVKSNFLSPINVIWAVQSHSKKYSDFQKWQITSLTTAVLSHWRGGSRSSRTRDRMRWTQGAPTTRALFLRTAKSCGPDAPTLASSSREAVPADDGGKKARSPGRARYKP